jgi:hypothetical protein
VDILLGIPLKRPTKPRSRMLCKPNRISHLWGWRRDLNPRPFGYKTDNHPLSCFVSVAIRPFFPRLAVQFGGFWMGNWMGKC